MNEREKKHYSTAELAKLLGVSRVAVFQKIVEGKIPAKKVGRSYVIDAEDVPAIIGTELSHRDKERIEESVQRTVAEYGETLRLLGDE
jgi:excisionase family DNA binding protein